jgi:hypothetical protein
MPADLKHRLADPLPSQEYGVRRVVRVAPRDSRERGCAAYEADHYEVQAYYYTTTSADALNVLEAALKAVPGV